jgi:hypothetical protein
VIVTATGEFKPGSSMTIPGPTNTGSGELIPPMNEVAPKLLRAVKVAPATK